MEKCKICGKSLTLNSIKCHTKREHGLTYNEYLVKFKGIIKKCSNCNKDITNLHPNTKYCCNECEIEYNNKKSIKESCKKFKDIKDIPVCKICGMKGKNLTSHLNDKHNISVFEYYKKYNAKKEDVYHISYTDKLKTLTGNKNPAYNHGGKLSPFSKKFLYYNENKRQETIEKASKNRCYTTRREYFLEESQANYDMADYLLSKRQSTFSLEKCIKKHGEKKGEKVWKDRQEKWLKSYEKLNYSKISQELFWCIYENVKEHFKDIYFAQLGKIKGKDVSGKNHEYRIDIGNTFCKADFLVKDINKIIEFDGDYWHKENKEKDKERDDKLLKSGYDVLHIKEGDYKKNPDAIVKKCLEFING